MQKAQVKRDCQLAVRITQEDYDALKKAVATESPEARGYATYVYEQGLRSFFKDLKKKYKNA